MMSYCSRKRLIRASWWTLVGMVVFVFAAPLALLLFWEWKSSFMLVAQSSRGYTVQVVGTEAVPEGADLLYQQAGTLTKIVHVSDDSESHWRSHSRAFWSRDGALCVVQDEVNNSYLVLDCGTNTICGATQGKLLLRRHGGLGTVIFDGWNDLKARSRYIWPWEWA